VALLSSGRYPVRNVQQNLADLQAQIAANEKGVQALRDMVAHFGLDVVRAYMRHVQANAEESVRRVIGVLRDGEFALSLDNGATIRVRISIGADRRSAVIDFAGTSPQLPNNFNAPSAVSMAAVLYVFRTLVDDEIPLNAGCLKPLEVRIPPGCMLNPRYPAAVVAGNVETSQCVTDTLYGALGVIAALAGIAVVMHPILGLAFLTLLLATYFVAEGVWKIIASFRYRPNAGWGWLLGSGLLSLVLGWLIWSQWPISGLWAVGVLVGVNLLATGAALVTLAGLSARAPRAP